MRIKLFLSRFFILFLGCLLSISSYAERATESDPVALLQYIANNMIKHLKENKATLKTKPQVVYALARQYVVPYADLSEMSRRVLPPATWNSASVAERKEFQHEFTTLLIRTYASALTSYQDQVVQFFPVRGGYQGQSTIEVASEIDSSENQPIHVTYRLIHIDGVWRLFDMSVEGVSLIESFRSQFADILANGNMDALLHRLATHNLGKGRTS